MPAKGPYAAPPARSCWAIRWLSLGVLGKGADVAERYDTPGEAAFADDELGPTVDALVGLAAGGPVLEFANAAHHLRPDGRFVIDHWIPQLGRDHGVPVIMSKDEDWVGIDTHDVARQVVRCDYYATRSDIRRR